MIDKEKTCKKAEYGALSDFEESSEMDFMSNKEVSDEKTQFGADTDSSRDREDFHLLPNSRRDPR